MKQILIILFIFLPFSLYCQFIETFDGPYVTSNNPWRGDLDYFFINSKNQLEMDSPQGDDQEVNLFIPITYAGTMTWEIRIKPDFKTTNLNNLRLYVYSTDKLDYYIQIGNNNRQISFYSGTGKANTLCIGGRRDILEEPSPFVSVILTMEENEKWTLYTRTEKEEKYHQEGSYKRKMTNVLPGGDLDLYFRNIKGRESVYYIDHIKVFSSLIDIPVKDDEDGGKDEGDPGENPGLYAPGTLLINEIMADEKGLTLLPETEYVEIHNPSESDIFLENWKFYYDTREIPLTPVTLPAGGYSVLCREGRKIKVDEGGIEMPLANFPSALANAGKLLQLKDPSGTLIDEVEYKKAKPARSWERSDNDWELSVDERGGTPGSINSVHSSSGGSDGGDPGEKPEPPGTTEVNPGDIIFNELLPNPYSGGSEYIELYNRSGKSISLNGLAISVRKADGTLNTAYPLNVLNKTLKSDSYALLTKDIEGVSSFYLISFPENMYELKLPVLANVASTLVLYRTADGVVIDELQYSYKWHSPSVNSEKGVALERIDPDAATQNPENWTSASFTAGYGTPGYKNSQYKNGDESTPTSIQPPVYREDGTYSIEYILDTAGYNCRIFIFDMSGKKVAEIANHKIVGTNGHLVWDGKSPNGRKLSSGIYILYVDLYHPQGNTKKYKKPFLVR